MNRTRRLAAALPALALLAGCSSSGSHRSDNPVISPPAPTTAVATPTAPPAPSSAAPATSAAAPSTAAPTTTSPSAPVGSTPPVAVPPVAQRSTCAKLGIRVLPGGASVGQEIAALQFTNEGSTPCTLVGYPSVSLLLNGRPAGRPSQPASTASSARTLAPGEVAESLLHNYVTNCQAPLSDSVRVVAPGSSASLVRPFQMRVCVLRVDKLGAPD